MSTGRLLSASTSCDVQEATLSCFALSWPSYFPELEFLQCEAQHFLLNELLWGCCGQCVLPSRSRSTINAATVTSSCTTSSLNAPQAWIRGQVHHLWVPGKVLIIFIAATIVFIKQLYNVFICIELLNTVIGTYFTCANFSFLCDRKRVRNNSSQKQFLTALTQRTVTASLERYL